MKSCTLTFPDSSLAPVKAPEGSNLSEVLDATNSPLLFGCRTGICGTCLVAVEGHSGVPDEDEREVLAILARGAPGARLACQVKVHSNLTLRPLPEVTS
jgi:ferredoxin